VGSVAGNIKYHSLGGPVKKYTPLAQRPEFGPEGKHFVTGNSLFFIMGGAQRPVRRGNEPKKDGCAQRTGAHARPKPTSSLCFSNQAD
jgi:hypothetical protein